MGTATLQAHKTWFFHADPNTISWTYNLKTSVKETYGGKVVQILSVNWDSLSVNFDSGSGGPGYNSGREYMKAFADFFKDAIIWQRDTGQPTIFTYPPKGYVMSCYLSSMGVNDSLQNVLFPFTIRAQIQRDLMGNIKGEAMTAALAKLSDGVGWSKNEYTYNPSNSSIIQDPAASTGASTSGQTEFRE